MLTNFPFIHILTSAFSLIFLIIVILTRRGHPEFPKHSAKGFCEEDIGQMRLSG